MPVWVWLFLIFCIASLGFGLWRAYDKKYFRYGGFIYSLDESPIYFWFFVVVFTICELFALTLFGLSVVAAIWGPIVHQ